MSTDIAEYRAAVIAETIGAAVYRAAKLDHSATVAMLAALLDDLGAGTPEPTLFVGQVRADAQWWAELAHPVEIEAYTAAGLRNISDKGRFCIAARKRIMVMMWNSLTADDRKGFLTHANAKAET